VHSRTGGVPRLLNQLCDYALIYAFADGRRTIDADLIAQVMRDRKSGHALPTFPTGGGAGAPAGLADGGAA